MNNEQIILSLLAFYKGQGMDLHYLLDDPVFDKMPVSDKVVFIKKHALDIYHGIPTGMSRTEKKSLAMATALGAFQGVGLGSAAGLAAAKKLNVASSPTAAIVGGIMLGIPSAIHAYRNAKSQVDSRNALRTQLGNYLAAPSDANAVGVLSIRGIHDARGRAMREQFDAINAAALESAKAKIPGAVENALLNEAAAVAAARNQQRLN